MPFRFLRQAYIAAAAAVVVALLGLPACNRAASREEKALRAELRQALHDQAYEKAAKLARRHLELRPQDNGTWDRLVQAHLGLRDLAGVEQTLEQWRRTVPTPSINLEEYTGDLAAAKTTAPRGKAWLKYQRRPKTFRARKMRSGKIQPTGRGTRLDAFSRCRQPIARINRALCRRRLQSLAEAFEDLQRAQALGGYRSATRRQTPRTAGKSSPRFARRFTLALSPTTRLLRTGALCFLRSQD